MKSKLKIPRPEHPEPQFERADWLNLNGIWEFEIDSGCSGIERGLASGKKLARKITVPFCPESNLSGIGNKDFMPCVWYRRKFQIPADWKGKNIILHFGAVDYDTVVWVNGKKTGTHRGGYTPFSFDITRLLRKGSNEVVVCAEDDTRSVLQPGGKQCPDYHSRGCHYTRTTGIWQTVWLEAVNQVHVKKLRMNGDIDSGEIHFEIVLSGIAENTNIIVEAFTNGKPAAKKVSATTGFTCFLNLPLKNVRLWSINDPFLYDLKISVQKDNGIIDEVKSYFGLRKISIDGKKVLLNNQVVFQRLVLDQGFYPDGIYTARTEADLKKDIELSMAMGFNGARLHQKVFEPRFLYWADKLGYLTWGEFANWGLDLTNPLVLERFLTEWIEALERDYNHPSIVGWCPFNETENNQNPEILKMVYRVTKSIDRTRPVIDTSGYVHVETDIYDCHNYEQDPAKFALAYEPFKKTEQAWFNPHATKNVSYAGQPYFVSEYGGIWWNPSRKKSKAWGYGARPKSEKEFLERYRKLTETLLFHPKMFGFCYTQLYDVEQEVNGLYTYERKPKFKTSIIRAINTQQAACERK